MKLTELSKEISYALRHAPHEYELELDEEGFVPIDQLLHAINEGGNYDRTVTKADLEEIIRTSEKKRHEIVGDKIRALYGHSVPQFIKKEIAALGMTEDEHRSKVYEILEKKHGRKVNFEMNEQGNYDGFIEDCYKEGINPEYVADGIVSSEKKASEGK